MDKGKVDSNEFGKESTNKESGVLKAAIGFAEHKCKAGGLLQLCKLENKRLRFEVRGVSRAKVKDQRVTMQRGGFERVGTRLKSFS